MDAPFASAGLRIKALRGDLSLREFAARLGVDHKSVSGWELGKRLPDGSSLLALNEQFAADLNYILTGQRSQPAAPTLTQDEAVLLDSYRRCTSTARGNLIQTAALLAAGVAATPHAAGMNMSNVHGNNNVVAGRDVVGYTPPPASQKPQARGVSKDNLMPLPPTYYEFIRHYRPLLAEMAEQDAKKLLQISPSHEGIHSSDDFDSSLAHFYEKYNAELIGLGRDHPGLTEEEMAPYLASASPQVKSFLMSLYATVNYEYHVLVNFALAGKKTFHFSNNLSEHLANTEINLKASLIQLPFQCCQFTFTSRAAIDAMHSIRGADGRIAINRSELDYTAPVSVFLTLLPSRNGLSGRTLLINAWHARQPNSYLMLKRQLHLDEGWTLEQALRTDWEELTPDNLGMGLNIEAGSEGIHHQDDDRFYTDGLFFFRFVLNAVLYLSSEKAEIGDIENPRKKIQETADGISSLSRRRKLLQSMKQHTALEFQEVGASVGPIVVRKDAKDGDSSSGGGDKLQVRFMVRGHWRRQPHGQENQERKLIWIRPHFKGPDIAEAINKPYLVK